MSRLSGSGAPEVRLARRRVGGQTPSVGISQGIDPVSIRSPSGAGASPGFVRLQQALGLGLSALEGVARAKIAGDKEAAYLDKSHGFERAQNDVVLFEQAITNPDQNPEWIVPEGMDLEAFADSVIAEQTQGLTEAHAQGYRSLRPSLLRMLGDQRERVKKEADGLMLELASSRFAFADGKDTIRSEFDELRRQLPDVDERERLAVLAPHMLEAARAGNRERVDAFRSVLGENLGLAQRQAQATLVDAEIQNRAQSNQAVANEVSDALLRGDADLATERLDGSVADGQTRLRLSGQIQTAKAEADQQAVAAELRQVITQGDPEGFATRTQSLIDEGRLTPAQRERALGELRVSRRDRMLADALLGDFKARQSVAKDARSALEAYQADPSSAAGITPEQYESVLSRAVEKQMQVSQRQVELARINEIMASAGQPGAAASPRAAVSPDAVVQWWGAAGVADVLRVGDRAVLRKVTQPERAALSASLLGGVVPGDWASQIADGFERGGELLPDAARGLIALHAQGETLSTQALGQMGDRARARAEYVLRHISRVGPAQASGSVDDNYVQRVSELSRESESLEPVALDQEKLRQSLIRVAPIKESTELRVLARDILREHRLEGFESRVGVPIFRDGRDFPQPGVAVTGYFERELMDSFRAALGSGMPEQAAYERAGREASARTFLRFPPVVWDGSVRLLEGGGPIVPELGDLARKALGAQIKAGGLDAVSVGAVERDYLPRWRADLDGWVLTKLGDDRQPLRNTDGQPVVLRYDPGSEKDAMDQVHKLLSVDPDEARRKRIEKRARLGAGSHNIARTTSPFTNR